MIVYVCKECGCGMCEAPSKEKGRCPQCGYKLYPNGYREEAINASALPGALYPAPSWEEDL